MILTVFQAVMYLLMALQVVRDHDVLTVLLMFLGLAATLAMVMVSETPKARIGAPICAAVQIGCGLLLLALIPVLKVPSYLAIAVEHMLLGCATLFLISGEAPDCEKQTLNSMS